MKNHIVSAFRLTLVMLAVVGIYLIVVYGGSKILPNQGNAEIINYKGQKFYANVGQEFKSENTSRAAHLLLIIMQREAEAAIKDLAMKNIWKLYRKE